MRNVNTVLGIGIFLMLIPLLGFPSAWKSFMIVFSGVILCGVSFTMRNNRPASHTHAHHSHRKHTRKIHPTTDTHLEAIPETTIEPQVYPPTNNDQNQTS